MTGIDTQPITFDRGSLSDSELTHLYRSMLYPRMIEEKMLNLLRQGQISKWFSGIGQEAISVGATAAMMKEEFIFPMHRNLGVFTSRGIPLTKLYAQWQGKADGFTKGRDRSFHFGTLDHHIVGMISHLGPQLSLAAGVALSYKLKASGQASLVFTGEGGTSQGEFHEALNVAAVWELPVLFIIENNGYGLSTPTREQYRCERLSDRALGYGIEGHTIDGNNILEVYQTIRTLADRARTESRPFLIECMTFRMRGHEEASGTKYVPKELMEAWAAKDPIDHYGRYLIAEGVLSAEDIDELRTSMKSEIQAAITAMDSPDPEVKEDSELADVYRSHEAPVEDHPLVKPTRELRFVDAVAEGLDQAMAAHDDLVLMGQDIADYGGVFKVTQGLMEKYGQDRVRNTPLCESAIIGAALGLTIGGMKAMVEMQFADFVSCGFNQIVNNLAKLHYRWGGPADVVIRMPTGGGMGAGPFHSQSMEAWFTHVPGLKVVYPATPSDAKGLLLASFDDPNPILFFEHKGLYRGIQGPVGEQDYRIPIGKARIARFGAELSIVTYGMGVKWAEDICDEMNVDAYILDLRSLLPLDYDAIRAAVSATHRVIVLHEATGFSGVGGEIAAYIGEQLFEYLDAPVLRCTSLDTPVPFGAGLEKQFLANDRLADTITQIINY